MKLQTLLKKSKLVEFIPYEELMGLKIETVPKDNFIYKDYDYSNVIFLLSGSAVLCHNQLEKSIFLPLLFRKGDFIGDHSANNRYKAQLDYYTFEDTIIAYIPREKMKRWKLKYPKLLEHLYETVTERDFIVHLYHYIRFHKGLTASLAFIIDTYSVGDLFKFKSITKFSIRLNSTRRNIHYAIKELEEAGAVEKIKNNRILVVDRLALKSIYEDEVFDY